MLAVEIHLTAVVHPAAALGRDVRIGPYAIIEEGATLGDRCKVEAFAIVKSGVTLGPDNHIFERATLGSPPQHIHARPPIGDLVIGRGNTIREGVTIHRALHAGQTTLVGDHNYIMERVHIAHDCLIGNHTIFANGATLAGHVTVQDRAFLSGNVAIHQFCRIGAYSIVGALGKVTKDVPPYMTLDGVPGTIVGLNSVGLRRNGFTADDMIQLKAAYRLIYRSGLTWQQVLDKLRAEFSTGPAARLAEFLPQSTRGIVHERRAPPGAIVRMTEEAPDEAILRIKAG